MKLLHHGLFQIVWIAFWAYWLFSARRVKQTKRAEPKLSRLLYISLVGFTFALIAVPAFHAGILGRRILPEREAVCFIGAALLVAGLSFAVWARVHLGQYWSGTVTLKEGHRLIRSGPYALVRHPIYTGILLGFLGTAVALGELRGALAFLLLLVIHDLKRRREERWLEEEFGEEYRSYHQTVNALVPFPRRTEPRHVQAGHGIS